MMKLQNSRLSTTVTSSKSPKDASQQAANALRDTTNNRPYATKQITLTNLPNAITQSTSDTRHSTSDTFPQSSNNTPNGASHGIANSTKRATNRITLYAKTISQHELHSLNQLRILSSRYTPPKVRYPRPRQREQRSLCCNSNCNCNCNINTPGKGAGHTTKDAALRSRKSEKDSPILCLPPQQSSPLPP